MIVGVEGVEVFGFRGDAHPGAEDDGCWIFRGGICL